MQRSTVHTFGYLAEIKDLNPSPVRTRTVDTM